MMASSYFVGRADHRCRSTSERKRRKKRRRRWNSNSCRPRHTWTCYRFDVQQDVQPGPGKNHDPHSSSAVRRETAPPRALELRNHGRPHIGANGVISSDPPPGKWMKNYKAKTCKKEHFSEWRLRDVRTPGPTGQNACVVNTWPDQFTTAAK